MQICEQDNSIQNILDQLKFEEETKTQIDISKCEQLNQQQQQQQLNINKNQQLISKQVNEPSIDLDSQEKDLYQTVYMQMLIPKQNQENNDLFSQLKNNQQMLKLNLSKFQEIVESSILSEDEQQQTKVVFQPQCKEQDRTMIIKKSRKLQVPQQKPEDEQLDRTIYVSPVFKQQQNIKGNNTVQQQENNEISNNNMPNTIYAKIFNYNPVPPQGENQYLQFQQQIQHLESNPSEHILLKRNDIQQDDCIQETRRPKETQTKERFAEISNTLSPIRGMLQEPNIYAERTQRPFSEQERENMSSQKKRSLVLVLLILVCLFLIQFYYKSLSFQIKENLDQKDIIQQLNNTVMSQINRIAMIQQNFTQQLEEKPFQNAQNQQSNISSINESEEIQHHLNIIIHQIIEEDEQDDNQLRNN